MFILGLIFPQPEKYFWAFCIDVEKSCGAGKLAFCYFQSDLCSLAPAAFKSGIFLQFSLKTAASGLFRPFDVIFRYGLFEQGVFGTGRFCRNGRYCLTIS